MSDDEPNELTILLRIVEVVELSLQKNSKSTPDRNRDSDQIIQITNKFARGSVIDSFL
jgi:hypothetical protein